MRQLYIRKKKHGIRRSTLTGLMDYTDRPGDVKDPWYTGDFEATWQDVLAGCRGFLSQLQKSEH